jgi:hypothetical protein
MSEEPSPTKVLADTLRAVVVERDTAIESLDDLEVVLTQIGGHLSSEHQAALARARTVLVACMRRPHPMPATWTDRVCVCQVLADGTGALRHADGCPLRNAGGL